MDKEYPYVCFRAEDVTPELPYSEIRRHIEHNDSMDTKRRQERMKRYRVETKSFRIGLALSDLCMRMLRDAKTDDWAEAEYLNLLSR